MRIEGKVAVVTGGSSGIGRAAAWSLAEAGARAVVVADVSDAGAMVTVSGVNERGSRGSFERVDVTDAHSMAALLSKTADTFGHVDILHNNAGVVAGAPAWPKSPVERIQTVINVNLWAVMLGTRLAVDFFGERGGAVVNTASIAAFGPLTSDPMYAATKAAVVSFTQSCRPLWQSHSIRVNAVLPGVTDTPILLKASGGAGSSWYERIAVLQPEDIGRAVVRIVEDESFVAEALVIDNPTGAGEPPVVTRLRTPQEFAAECIRRAEGHGVGGAVMMRGAS